VDEFEISTPQKGEQGRSKSAHKTRVVIALEYRNGKAGRGYVKIIVPSDWEKYFRCISVKTIK
jgi:hypothetical protein